MRQDRHDVVDVELLASLRVGVFRIHGCSADYKLRAPGNARDLLSAKLTATAHVVDHPTMVIGKQEGIGAHAQYAAGPAQDLAILQKAGEKLLGWGTCLDSNQAVSAAQAQLGAAVQRDQERVSQFRTLRGAIKIFKAQRRSMRGEDVVRCRNLGAIHPLG